MRSRNYILKKRPVVEAFLFDPMDATEIQDKLGTLFSAQEVDGVSRYYMFTPHGKLEVHRGDYVMKALGGGWYPVHATLFDTLYRPAK